MYRKLLDELEQNPDVKNVEYDGGGSVLDLSVEFNKATTWDVVRIPMKLALDSFLTCTEYSFKYGKEYEYKFVTVEEIEK